MFNMQKRRLRGDLKEYLKRAYKQDQLFTQLGNDRRREKGSKLQEGIFRLAITGKIFTDKVVRCLNTLPREVVDGS